MASIYLTGVIEYLTAEMLELAGNAAKDNKKKRITPRHIMLSAIVDEELNRFMKAGNVIFPCAGVAPFIHRVLLAPKPNLQNEETSLPSLSVVASPEVNEARKDT
jgi:histone H2A